MLSQLQDYAAHVRLFSRNARLFLVAAILGGVTAGVTNLLLNLYLVSLGYPEGALPGFSRFGQVGAAGAALAGGPLIDRLGAKRSMLVGTFFVASGTVALLLQSRPVGLGLAWFVVNAGTLVVYIAAPSFLTAHSSRAERPYLFGVAFAAYIVSTAIGAGLGGILPSSVRALSPSLGDADVYRTALLVGGLLSAVGIFLLFGVREGASDYELGENSPTSLSRPIDAIRNIGRQLMDPGFVRLASQFILADGLIRVGGNLFLPYLNVYFVRHLQASEALYGSLRTAERALVVLTTLSVALLVMRYGPVATIVATQILSIPFLLFLGAAPVLGAAIAPAASVAPTLAVASAAFLIRGPLMEMTQPTRDNFLMDVAPPRSRASLFAALTLAGYAIGFAASYLAEYLLKSNQFQLAFGAAAVLYVISAILYWLFFRSRPEAAPGHTLDLASLAR